ncbi:hypothetical protein F4553_001519 [Allocatelliglobosispora scoriae]|uniref:Uncharacterized protein n=1 Tax=Allocatelliglobosispora scoriae TaxID=643052 RepID=A0A841BMU1_9ACTN|nr:hypothetical protein [Allocatelliglobosispora scoriae]MBB5868140.1 hypothetical protein [Allocatelliglobosispora scoriae]
MEYEISTDRLSAYARLRIAARRTTAARLPLLLGLLGVGFVAQRVSQGVLDGFYARSGYPVPYYVGQLSFSGRKLSEWYSAMEQGGTLGIYWQTQFVDFGFIAATALFFTAVLLLVARAMPPGRAARTRAVALVPLALVAPALDVLENLISFVLLGDPAQVNGALAIVYSTVAAVKFAGFAFVYLWTVVGLLAAALLRIRGRSLATR